MKVVLFCGGLGTRLREHSDTIPKPLVEIGNRPVVWHLMKYYAHYGHKQFILCLGYRGNLIKEYFLNYQEWMSNDFVLRRGGAEVELRNRDIDDWEITFVDTGLHSNIGERLVAVRDLVAGEDIFLANYADGLSDSPLDEHLDRFRASDAVAGFLSVRSPQSYHAARIGDDGFVEEFGELADSGLWVNGGFFAMRPEIFDYINPGEELVEKPFHRLVDERRLMGFRHSGFWACMDTFKDKINFDRRHARGDAPWEIWR